MAQLVPEGFFLEGSLGRGMYFGERGLQSTAGSNASDRSDGPEWEVGVGYRWRASTDIVFVAGWGTYPGIISNSPGHDIIFKTQSEEDRSLLRLEVRYRLLPFGKFEPTLIAGLATASGTINKDNKVGLGPLFGLGLSRPFGRTDLFVSLG